MGTRVRKKVKVEGHCRLCGKWAELSYDHVPPKAVGNRVPVLRADFVQAMELGLDGSLKDLNTEKEEPGAGYNSFCRDCNSNMGLWYVPAYAQWVKQAWKYMPHAENPHLVYIEYEIYPLRCLKEVLAMFFSINNEKMRELYPELARFVMDKESQDLPAGIEVYAYLTTSGVLRYMGISVQLRKDKGIDKPITSSEISFPPFGFFLCLRGSPAPDERLQSINHFSQYGYDDKQSIHLRLYKLPVLLPLTGDYRTENEIRAHEERERLRALGLIPPK